MLNVFDIGIILLLIMFIIVGFKNGAIKELFSLVGIIVVFVLSYALKGLLGNILCIVFPFFNISGVENLTVMNILLYQAVAFIIVFAILLTLYEILLKVSKFIQKLVNLTIILIIPSKIIGGAIALIKGWIVLFAVFLCLMIPLKNVELFTSSTMVNKLIYNTPVLSSHSSSFISTTEEIFDLEKQLSNKEISTNEANLKTLDLMLKHKIVDKKTVEQLVSLHKLDDVSNIESVLNKY